MPTTAKSDDRHFGRDGSLYAHRAVFDDDAVPAPGAELPREVFNAWIKTRREKTASLALSWAREQLRLSLEETIARSPGGRASLGLAPDTLAWLLLAACEAIAHEPPSAVPDRVRAVLELSGHAAASG